MDWAALLALIRLKPILINGLGVVLAVLLRQNVIESSAPLWAVYLLFAVGFLGASAALAAAFVSWLIEPGRDLREERQARLREPAVEPTTTTGLVDQIDRERLRTVLDEEQGMFGVRVWRVDLIRDGIWPIQMFPALAIAIGVPLGAIIASPVT